VLTWHIGGLTTWPMLHRLALLHLPLLAPVAVEVLLDPGRYTLTRTWLLLLLLLLAAAAAATGAAVW
jgi:hypothetical protein